MNIGLQDAQEKLKSPNIQKHLPLIQVKPKDFGFVKCQICDGKGVDPDNKKCGFCIGFKVLPKEWWQDWNHPLDLNKKLPKEDSYNILPYVDCILEGLFYWYMQFPDKCPTCALDKINPIPDCINICRFKVRTAGGKIQCIDTRRDFPPGTETPFGTLLISRFMLIFNFEHKLDWIFRNGKGTGTEVHHKNGKPYDDRYENCILTDIHKVIEGHKKTIDTQSKFINNLFKSGKIDKEDRKKLLHGEKRYKKLLDSTEASPRVWSYISDMNEVISQFKMYGQVPKVLREKIGSYVTV